MCLSTSTSPAVAHFPRLFSDMQTLTNRETVKIFPHMQAGRILASTRCFRQRAAECDARTYAKEERSNTELHSANGRIRSEHKKKSEAETWKRMQNTHVLNPLLPHTHVCVCVCACVGGVWVRVCGDMILI